MKTLKIIRSGSPEKKVSTRVCICHITSFCNLGCSYCVVRNSLNTVQWSRDVFFRNIDRVKEDGTTSTLAFFGGEPFVHPDLLDAVAKCKAEINCELSAMSNLVVPMSYLHKLYTLDPDFRITVSIHFEKLNIPKFLEKAAFLATRNYPGIFKLMLHPQYRKEAHTIYEELVKLMPSTQIMCSMIRFPEDSYATFSKEYLPEDWDFMNMINAGRAAKECFVEFRDEEGQTYIVKDKYETLLQKDFLHFKDLLCSVNAHKVIIDREGHIRDHVCEHRSKKPLDAPLYNTTPIKCSLANCYCGAHVAMPKFDSSVAASSEPGTPSPASVLLDADSIEVRKGDDGHYAYFLRSE